MTSKQIIGIIVLILMLPSLFGLFIFSLNLGHQTPEQNTQQATNLLVDSVTPWWLGLVQTLANWGTFGAIVLIAFFFLLTKYPELK